MPVPKNQISPLQLWCLHGNLQTPSVWDSLQLHLQQHLPSVQVHTENLWETPAEDCWDWAEKFGQRVKTEPASRRILLGYSLGGRLALHAVIHEAQLWHGAAIIAADPGIATQNSQERAAQLQRDLTWADRFRTEPLPKVMADWNQLPLFGGKSGPTCNIEPYRQAIAAAFVNYSKGRQTDLRSQLQALAHPPMLYITGSKDQKYAAIGKNLAEHCPDLHHSSIPASGHRAPWDNPALFNLRIVTFINHIEQHC